MTVHRPVTRSAASAKRGTKRPTIVFVGYGLDGTERFRLSGRIALGYVTIAGGYAYVGSNNSRRFEVVDPRSGQRVGQASFRQPTVVVGSA